MQSITGDITKIKGIDAIVNPINALGDMGGTMGVLVKLPGVSEAINYKTKGKVEKELKQILKIRENNKMYVKLGDVIITGGYNCCKYMFNVVTVEKPGGKSDLETISKICDSLIKNCRSTGIKSIAIPYIGCGIGSLNKSDVHEIFREKFSNINDFNIYIIDKR